MKATDGKCVIAMQSMTGAMGAEQVLLRSGIYVKVIKLPTGSTKKGCSYGLELSCAYAPQAMKRLDAAGIRYGELLSMR